MCKGDREKGKVRRVTYKEERKKSKLRGEWVREKGRHRDKRKREKGNIQRGKEKVKLRGKGGG